MGSFVTIKRSRMVGIGWAIRVLLVDYDKNKLVIVKVVYSCWWGIDW